MPSSNCNASAELYDLGQARFDSETAGISDRDYALNHPQAPRLRPQNTTLNDGTFSWHTFYATTEERDARAERKNELHEGQLHRANRAALVGYGAQGGGLSGERAGRKAGGVEGESGSVINGMARSAGGTVEGSVEDGAMTDPMWAGRRPEAGGMPLARGSAEEVGRELFWEGPIRGVRG